MVTVRFRGRFRCQRIIDSWLPVQDPRGSGAGCRCTTHDLIFISNFALFSVFKKILFNVNHFVIISRFFYITVLCSASVKALLKMLTKL